MANNAQMGIAVLWTAVMFEAVKNAGIDETEAEGMAGVGLDVEERKDGNIVRGHCALYLKKEISQVWPV
jgi:hypothetical protein